MSKFDYGRSDVGKSIGAQDGTGAYSASTLQLLPRDKSPRRPSRLSSMLEGMQKNGCGACASRRERLR